MFAFIARQPIFDADKNLFAYELLFRDGESNCFPDISPDEATSKLLSTTHLSLGIEEITGEAKAFINFHREALMNRFPTSLDPKKVIIEVLESVEVDDSLVSACEHIQEMGYQIALDDYDSDEKWQPFIPFTSIIKFDLTETPAEKLKALVPPLQAKGIKLVAEKVETKEEFEQCKALGFDYFQGYFFAKPEIIRHRKMSNSKLSMLELLAASSEKELDYAKINAVLERDVSLSYLLLRFINNPMFNKRNQISSLKHALTYLGELEVKKFIALMALANLSDGQPKELLQMSLVRAKFCELTSLALKIEENPPTGFLAGLLSLIDTMMEQNMGELMEKVPVADSVREALCGQDNVLRNCLQIVTEFENGNWRAIALLAKKLGVKQHLLHHFYNEGIKWARAMQISAENQAL